MTPAARQDAAFTRLAALRARLLEEPSSDSLLDDLGAQTSRAKDAKSTAATLVELSDIESLLRAEFHDHDRHLSATENQLREAAVALRKSELSVVKLIKSKETLKAKHAKRVEALELELSRALADRHPAAALGRRLVEKWRLTRGLIREWIELGWKWHKRHKFRALAGYLAIAVTLFIYRRSAAELIAVFVAIVAIARVVTSDSSSLKQRLSGSDSADANRSSASSQSRARRKR